VTLGSRHSGLRIGGVFFLALSLAAPFESPADAAEEAALPPRETFREAFRTFSRDGRYLVTFPARVNAEGVWLTAGVVAATALAMNRDEEIRANVIESDRPVAGRVATKFEPLGRLEVEAAALGALYFAGRGAKNGRVVSTAATAFEAYLWAAVITSVTKGAFGRERPERGTGEGEFFAGDTIFPSGHTARSFAIAAVFSARGGRKAACIAYPVAAFVGLSTVQQDRHWASDVVAGAGLGLAIGKGIATRHPAAGAGPAPGGTWIVVPRPGGAALRVVF
jgi:membrane-associated phospholipid phosphatase